MTRQQTIIIGLPSRGVVAGMKKKKNGVLTFATSHPVFLKGERTGYTSGKPPTTHWQPLCNEGDRIFKGTRDSGSLTRALFDRAIPLNAPEGAATVAPRGL